MQPAFMSVDEFTTPDPITVNENMGIDELQQLMASYGIRHLPVLRGDVVVGIISDRDVRLAAGLSVAEKYQICAADLMAADPLSVRADARLDEVALLMSANKVGSVIVNETDGKFLGIFTATDALNALVEIVRGVDEGTH